MESRTSGGGVCVVQVDLWLHNKTAPHPGRNNTAHIITHAQAEHAMPTIEAQHLLSAHRRERVMTPKWSLRTATAGEGRLNTAPNKDASSEEG